MMIKPQTRAMLAALALALCLGGCARSGPATPETQATQRPERVSTQRPAASRQPTPAPQMPATVALGADGAPVLKVYLTESQSIQQMRIEEYLMGVLAGEMKNDWPLEALKAQAIIARTFALKFIEDKGGSQYEGADVSTDVTEAQAYNAQEINDRVRQAIEETRGQVIAYQGELTYAWFHAHAGGITAQAKEGLEWEGEEPPYIQSMESPDAPEAPQDDAQWTASFPMDQVGAVLKEMGFNFQSLSSISIGETGPSGRVVTFDIEGTPVSAPSLRVRLDPATFKSTLLSSAGIKEGVFTVSGKGYGHGVGMSQWGAYGMAEQGKSAQEIIEHYYRDVQIVHMW